VGGVGCVWGCVFWCVCVGWVWVGCVGGCGGGVCVCVCVCVGGWVGLSRREMLGNFRSGNFNGKTEVGG